MLLRAIQERRYRPVGDKADRNFNVRIIAATNENLEKAVSEKRFRQDLLYRLHDFEITVPPLRDCQEDILPLAEFFRETANQELECRVEGFSSEARKALLSHPWPGNARTAAKDYGEQYCRTGRYHQKGTSRTWIGGNIRFRRFRTAQRCGGKGTDHACPETIWGNRYTAAKILGIGRTTLYKKLEEYGLKYKFEQS